MGDLPGSAPERARLLQNMLIDHATDGRADEATYRRLRAEFIANTKLRPLLPDFVRECRDLPQFWGHIKHRAGTYRERREIIWRAFAPLLDQLEILDPLEERRRTPPDSHISGRAQPETAEQDLLDQANAFFQAGTRCSADFGLSPNITNSLTAPAVVCFAFAVELYLKLLLKLAGRAAEKRHALADLFAGLPPEAKKSASDNYCRYFGRSEGQLGEDISRVSAAFVDWRYLHEVPSVQISISVLREIGRALHNTIRQSRPKLGVTFENRLAMPADWIP